MHDDERDSPHSAPETSAEDDGKKHTSNGAVDFIDIVEDCFGPFSIRLTSPAQPSHNNNFTASLSLIIT
jgi:hypothetical protein